MKKKVNSKKMYDKKKKKKNFIKFLKEYSSVIMIIITIFAFIPNLIIWYYKKINSSDFYVSYLTVSIDSDDWVKTYISKNGENAVFTELSCPTINNSINQLLYKYPDKVKGYYITYLIVSERGETPASDVTIKFNEYGKASDLEDNNLEDLKINKKSEKTVYKKIGYPMSEGEKIKIPISICKIDNLYTLEKKECYYIEEDPISITFKNKYMIHNKTVEIRPYIENNIIIDGEMITGKGSA